MLVLIFHIFPVRFGLRFEPKKNIVTSNRFELVGEPAPAKETCILKIGILKMGSPGRGACSSQKNVCIFKGTKGTKDTKGTKWGNSVVHS